MSVCPSVCNTVTFESLDVESSFLICRYRYVLTEYQSRSYMKVKIKVTAAKENEISSSHTVNFEWQYSTPIEDRTVTFVYHMMCLCHVMETDHV